MHLRVETQIDLRGDDCKALVVRPEAGLAGQGRAGQQMGIGPANASPVQRVPLQEIERFGVCGDWRLGQQRQLGQQMRAPTQMTARQLTDHERMAQHDAGLEAGR